MVLKPFIALKRVKNSQKLSLGSYHLKPIELTKQADGNWVFKVGKSRWAHFLPE